MKFEDIVAKCIEDISFAKEVLKNTDLYQLSIEEIKLLKETDFSEFGFQADERSALSVLSMWGAISM